MATTGYNTLWLERMLLCKSQWINPTNVVVAAVVAVVVAFGGGGGGGGSKSKLRISLDNIAADVSDNAWR